MKKMNKTKENLGAAFAGESQANRKYLAFAKRAESEGKPGIAKIFRLAAEGETVHALNHLAAMEGVKDTRENLKSAVAGETYEIEEMYPGFVAEAESEKDVRAKISLSNAAKVEEIHKKLFQEALEKLEAGEDLVEKEFWVCQVCGYPGSDEAPEKCPICGAPRERFERM